MFFHQIYSRNLCFIKFHYSSNQLLKVDLNLCNDEQTTQRSLASCEKTSQRWNSIKSNPANVNKTIQFLTANPMMFTIVEISNRVKLYLNPSKCCSTALDIDTWKFLWKVIKKDGTLVGRNNGVRLQTMHTLWFYFYIKVTLNEKLGNYKISSSIWKG